METLGERFHMNRFLVAGLIAATALSNAAYANKIPAGLDAGEWQAIQSQVIAAQYHAHESDSGYDASNRAHGFHARFNEDGSTAVDTGAANIQFRLVSDQPQPQSISLETNTVTYQWSDNLREWWVNDENGMEQWFEIAERPSNQQSLTLNIELQTNLDVSLANNQLMFSDENTRLTYDKLLAWDATGKELPSHMSLESTYLTLHVDDSNVQYPITIDPTLSQRAYLKASNTGERDQFGFSVAVSGDTAVVGAATEDSNAAGVNGDESNNLAPDSGAAYVFIRAEGVWSQQAYLKASNPGDGDQFGFSIAIDGDTIVVGAWREDSNATGIDGDQSNDLASDSGAAYVFTRSGGVWSQQAYLKGDNTQASDNFGFSVALDEDTLVVGARLEDSSSTGVNGDGSDNGEFNSGAAYVFVRAGTTWSQEAYLKASNTESNDWFGTSVAIYGDSAVVGAPSEDSNATGVDGNESDNSAIASGAAYVFTRSAGIWNHQAYLKASNTEQSDQFGTSVGIHENTIVVGAPYEASGSAGINSDGTDNSRSRAGAAYIFLRTGSSWLQQAYFKASNPNSNVYFGWSSAITDEVVIIGARQEHSIASSSGGAYRFVRNGTVWAETDLLKASNAGNSDSFGYKVSTDADTVIVGAVVEDSAATGVNGDESDNSAENAGAAYIFAPRDRRIIITGN